MEQNLEHHTVTVRRFNYDNRKWTVYEKQDITEQEQGGTMAMHTSTYLEFWLDGERVITCDSAKFKDLKKLVAKYENHFMGEKERAKQEKRDAVKRPTMSPVASVRSSVPITASTLNDL
jgi:hypothetical protein